MPRVLDPPGANGPLEVYHKGGLLVDKASVDRATSKVDSYQVTLSLEGLPGNRGAVRLGDLAFELQALNALLLGLDRAVSPSRRVSTDYHVIDMRRVNPAQVTIGGTPKAGEPDVRPVVFTRPFETIQRVDAGETTGFDYDLLEDIKQISEPVGKRLSRAALSWNGYEANLTTELRDRIANLLEPQLISAGFIQGRIEAVNIHQAANIFKLYPRVGPTRLTGHFPEALSGQVGAALGKDVVVSGRLRYRADEPNAYAIETEAIEILPDINTLPTFNDLLGAAPDLTEGLSTEEWLAKRRAEIEPVLRGLLGI